MLLFQENNTFIASESTGYLAPKTKLIPFQIFVNSSLKYISIVSFKLVNGSNEIDLIADINKLKVYTSESATFVVFDGILALNTTLTEGRWQVEFTIKLLDYEIVPPVLYNKTYYSNYINVVCDDLIRGRLEYWNSKDFQNIIFQAGYKEIIYFATFLKNEPNYKKETIIEQGDGTQIVESQIIANGYSFIIRGDKFLVEQTQKLPFFDNAKIYTNDFDGVDVFQRISSNFTFEKINYNYNINIAIFVKNSDKELCLGNKDIILQDSWILTTGFWNDLSIWKDSENWNDGI